MQTKRLKQRMKLVNLEWQGEVQPRMTSFMTQVSEIDEDFTVDRITLDANGNTVDIFFEFAGISGFMCISEFDEEKGLFGWTEMVIAESENGINDVTANRCLDAKRKNRRPAVLLRGDALVVYERLHGIPSPTELYNLLCSLHRFRSGIIRKERSDPKSSEEHSQIEPNCSVESNYSH